MRLEQLKKSPFLPIFFFFITIFTRIPFTSKFLYHADSVHFALALKKYDITTHQPHPPGYFLYVMLGRLLNLFIKDENTIFITISILFSWLTVVAIYYLSKEMFDEKIAIIASALTITSPNIWFHGEVALTYIVEAFFSTLIALFSWKIYKNKGENIDKYLYLSAIALGIAGGIRQNTTVFLLPLWLFSIKNIPLKKIVLAFFLLGIVCLLWFLPMINMTGGYDAYKEAFRELWLFNTGKDSVFHKGWISFKTFSTTLYNFIVHGLGAAILTILFSFYLILRNKKIGSLDRSKSIFLAFWIAPSFLFYLLIFIHYTNPGYILIFLPALLIVAGISIRYIAEDLEKILKKDLLAKITIFIVLTNTIYFLFLNHPASFKAIKTHDKDLSIMLHEIKTFDPSRYAIFVLPYTFYGYRHIMYYLPEYRVYQIDVRVALSGEIRKTFWGINKETYLSDKIILPDDVKNFVSIFISEDINMVGNLKPLNIKNLTGTKIHIVTGNISLLKEIYPELSKYNIL